MTPNKESLLTNKNFLTFFGAFFVLLFITMLLVINISSQVDELEEQLKHSPPQALEATGSKESETASKAIYVPVYSHVYAQGGKPFLLETTLSIRNTDTAQPITLTAVKYFNTTGELVKDYLERPVSLAPMATTEVLVEQQNTKGGSGANFLVEWSSQEGVNPPRVEAVMVGSKEHANISFVSVGISLKN